jgi:predicted RNA methylase
MASATDSSSAHGAAPADEVRFGFGRNWQAYLRSIDETKLLAAEAELRQQLGGDLHGKTFLDIGSGSGIHSLAAFRLGAKAIVSFDYDADSVACTRQMHERAGAPATWRVLQGSVLDAEFLATLGTFDVVYSWGVLHHTGAMWQAVERAISCCGGPGSLLLIGLYHKKRWVTPAVKQVKRAYSAGGPLRRGALLTGYVAATLAYATARGQLRQLLGNNPRRGMNAWHDLVDWVGGYPFEAATPAEVVAFVEARGFKLRQSETFTSFAAVNTFLFERQ